MVLKQDHWKESRKERNLFLANPISICEPLEIEPRGPIMDFFGPRLAVDWRLPPAPPSGARTYMLDWRDKFLCDGCPLVESWSGLMPGSLSYLFILGFWSHCWLHWRLKESSFILEAKRKVHIQTKAWNRRMRLRRQNID